MAGQPGVSRGPAFQQDLGHIPWANAPSRTVSRASSSLIASSFRSTISNEGRARATWRLPSIEDIPTHPILVPSTQLESDTFSTGDGAAWKFQICRTSDDSWLSVFLRKQDCGVLEKTKTLIEFRLSARQPDRRVKEIDRFTKMIKFSFFKRANGFVKAFGLHQSYSEPFVLEAFVSAKANNDASRKETQFVGLQNIGMSCYSNALLQTLFHIPNFRQSVFEVWITQIPTQPDRSSVAYCLQKVFFDLTNSLSSVSMRDLLDSLEVDEEPAQQDVHEFSLAFADKLKDSISKCGMNEFYSQLFEGKMETVIKCENVPVSSEPKIEAFTDLQLAVTGVKDLIESLDEMTSEKMNGENQFLTEDYGLQDALRTVRFLHLPPVLQVYLKRFQYHHREIQKVNDLFSFPETLDLTPYSAVSGKCKYVLFSILVHKGVTQHGHYFALVKSNLSEWMKFNDHSVDQITPEQVFRSSFGGKMKDLKVTDEGEIEDQFSDNDMSAYMLFYLKEDQIRSLLNPVIEIPPLLSTALAQALPPRLPTIQTPAKQPVVIIAKDVPEQTFKAAYVTCDLLKGWKGPGLMTVDNKPLVPNENSIKYLTLPMSYTAAQLQAKISQENNKKCCRIWLFYPQVKKWEFRNLPKDSNLSLVLGKKLTQILYIETEDNFTMKVKHTSLTSTSQGGESDSTETLSDDSEPLADIDFPLKQKKEGVLFFIKAYKCAWGQGELALVSAANLYAETVSLEQIRNYVYARITKSSGVDALDLKLYIERSKSHSGELIDLAKTDADFLSVKKAPRSILIENGDVIIGEEPLDQEFPEYLSAIDYYRKLVSFTTVSFLPELGESERFLDLGELAGKLIEGKPEFKEEISQNSKLKDVLEFLAAKFSVSDPSITSPRIAIFSYNRQTKSLTRFPHPTDPSNPTKNPALSEFAENKQIHYAIDRPMYDASSGEEMEVEVFYINSDQSWNPKPIRRMMRASSTIKDVKERIFEEVSEMWTDEKPGVIPPELTLYMHSKETKAYFKKLPVMSRLDKNADGQFLISCKPVDPHEGTDLKVRSM